MEYINVLGKAKQIVLYDISKKVKIIKKMIKEINDIKEMKVIEIK